MEKQAAVNNSTELKTETPYLIVNAETIAPEQTLFDSWCEAMSPFFAITTPNPNQHQSEVRAASLSKLLIIETKADAQIFNRDRQRIAQYDNDCLAVQIFLNGSNAISNQRKNFDAHNQCIILDMGKPAVGYASDAHVLSVLIAKEDLALPWPILNNCAGILCSTSHSDVQVLLQVIKQVWLKLPDLTLKESEEAYRGITNIIEKVMRRKYGCGVSFNSAIDEAFERATSDTIYDYIKKNIKLTHLSTAHLCKRFCISRAKLYRLFHERGGVAHVIKQERLLHAYKTIISQRHDHRLIIDIASDWGFDCQSNFSRDFKIRFGISPREAREIAKSNMMRQQTGMNMSQLSVSRNHIQTWMQHVISRSA